MLSPFYPRILVAAALLTLAMLAAPRALASPSAVTFTVNSTLDQPDDLTTPGTCHTAANTCTLRAAVMQANRTSGAGATIVVPSGIYTLTIPRGADDEGTGDLNLTTPAPGSGSPAISIIGAGSASTIIDANQLDRVLHIAPGRTVSISGVTLRNGYTLGDGGGIYISNDGFQTLTLSNVTIYGNYAVNGGGIYSLAWLQVSNSTIYGNVAGSGGGIFISRFSKSAFVISSTISQNNGGMEGGGIVSQGDLSVLNSTISGNVARDGGGILNIDSLTVINSTLNQNHANGRGAADFYPGNGGGIINYGSLTVINSTLSQNNANTDGGGIYNYRGVANIYNASIVFNGADANADANGGSGGGVYNNSGASFDLRNTLVAGNNVSDAPVYQDCSGFLFSYGRNMFFTPSNGCTIVNMDSAYDTLNSLDSLGPLQNNGGPTWTRALLRGSNAIDGGDPVLGCIGPDSTPLASDQRGATRVAGARCDIGAFEYRPLLYVRLPVMLH